MVEVRELLGQVGALSRNWRRRYGSSLSSLCVSATVLAGLFGLGRDMLLSSYYLCRVEGTKDPFSFPPANFVLLALQCGRSQGFPPPVILCSQYYKSPSALWGDS